MVCLQFNEHSFISVLSTRSLAFKMGGGESTVTIETVIIRGWGEATNKVLFATGAMVNTWSSCLTMESWPCVLII